MSKAAKILAGMVVNPKSDWTIDQVTSVAEHYGLKSAPHTAGAHFQFFDEKTPEHPVTVPAISGRKVPDVAIKTFLGYLLSHSPEAAQECREHLSRDKAALKQLQTLIDRSTGASRA